MVIGFRYDMGMLIFSLKSLSQFEQEKAEDSSWANDSVALALHCFPRLVSRFPFLKGKCSFSKVVYPQSPKIANNMLNKDVACTQQCCSPFVKGKDIENSTSFWT